MKEGKLPLAPHMYLPSLNSGLKYPGKVTSFPEGLVISDSGHDRVVVTDKNGDVKVRFISKQLNIFQTPNLLIIVCVLNGLKLTND